MKVTKLLYLLFILFSYEATLVAQIDTNTTKEQGLLPVHIDRRFHRKYKLLLEDVRKVYPLALEAKQVIEEYEKELQEIEKKRQQKKYLKKSEKELKLNFEYTVKDLYVSEGRLLMKLIHRETGMTVDEILRKYKGNLSASSTGAALRLFGHDTKITYDAEQEWILEMIIQDILSGRVACDMTPKKLNKYQFKEGMKEYRDDRKEINKKKRAYKKTQKKGQH